MCLLLDESADRAVRRLWRRLEDGGVPTLLSHTHGRHLPHLTLASLRSYDLAAVTAALAEATLAEATLAEHVGRAGAEPLVLRFDALGAFRRTRCWLAPAVSSDLVARQQAVVAAVATTGAELHRHYRPGEWVPHLTLAPRLHLDQLPRVAAAVYDVLPLTATATRTALVETSTGTVHPLG